MRPIGAAPTGRTGVGDMPFTTPAADVYQATPAVTTPAQPPAWRTHVAVGLCASRKNPITSRISVISRVRKTPKTATLTRVLQRSMYVLKTANAKRNQASALNTFAAVRLAANVFETS